MLSKKGLIALTFYIFLQFDELVSVITATPKLYSPLTPYTIQIYCR